MTDHQRVHAAMDELKTRWEALGFVRKGKRAVVRAGDFGLQILRFEPPTTRRASFRLDVGVWLAALEQRELGTPAAWPTKRYALPEESRWHAMTELSVVVGAEGRYFGRSMCEQAGLPLDRLADLVWQYWPQMSEWLDKHARVAWLAQHLGAEARAENSADYWDARPAFRIPGLCFLELGDRDAATALMEQELANARRDPDATSSDPEKVAAWWAPILAGTRHPQAATPDPAVLRDAITYSSPAPEWIRTRDPMTAQERVYRALSVTTDFAGWQSAALTIDPAVNTEAHRALFSLVEAERPDMNVAERRMQTFDRAALDALGVPVDEVLSEALRSFGPCMFWRWSSGMDENPRDDRFHFHWETESAATIEKAVAYCARHRTLTREDKPRVALLLSSSRELTHVAPGTRAPLPWQDAEHYPPECGLPAPCYASAMLWLPECRLAFDAKLPFLEAGGELDAWCEAIAAPLGHRFSRKNFRAARVNKKGTAAALRKL